MHHEESDVPGRCHSHLRATTDAPAAASLPQVVRCQQVWVDDALRRRACDAGVRACLRDLGPFCSPWCYRCSATATRWPASWPVWVCAATGRRQMLRPASLLAPAQAEVLRELGQNSSAVAPERGRRPDGVSVVTGLASLSGGECPCGSSKLRSRKRTSSDVSPGSAGGSSVPSLARLLGQSP